MASSESVRVLVEVQERHQPARLTTTLKVARPVLNTTNSDSSRCVPDLPVQESIGISCEEVVHIHGSISYSLLVLLLYWNFAESSGQACLTSISMAEASRSSVPFQPGRHSLPRIHISPEGSPDEFFEVDAFRANAEELDWDKCVVEHEVKDSRPAAWTGCSSRVPRLTHQDSVDIDGNFTGSDRVGRSKQLYAAFLTA